MRVLLVTTELAPFAVVSGLGDTVKVLSKELLRLSHDVRVAMPCYPVVEYDARYNVRPVLDEIAVPWLGGETKHAFVKTAVIEGVPVYLIGSPEYFKDILDSSNFCKKNQEFYTFFARAVLEALKAIKPRWTPKVIHVSSWHSGIIPAVYLNVLRHRNLNLRNVAVVTTVHDVVSQSEFEFQGANDAAYVIGGIGRLESDNKEKLLRTAKDYELLYKDAQAIAKSRRQQEKRVANHRGSSLAAA